MPRFPLSRSLPFALLLVAVAAAAIAALGLRGTAVDTVTVAEKPLQQTVVVSGRVLAPARVDIGATLTARVVRVAVEEGDRVAAGSLLV